MPAFNASTARGAMSQPKAGCFEMLAIIEECEGGTKAVGEYINMEIERLGDLTRSGKIRRLVLTRKPDQLPHPRVKKVGFPWAFRSISHPQLFHSLG